MGNWGYFTAISGVLGLLGTLSFFPIFLVEARDQHLKSTWICVDLAHGDRCCALGPRAVGPLPNGQPSWFIHRGDLRYLGAHPPSNDLQESFEEIMAA